jgi:hypothetical protein
LLVNNKTNHIGSDIGSKDHHWYKLIKYEYVMLSFPFYYIYDDRIKSVFSVTLWCQTIS